MFCITSSNSVTGTKELRQFHWAIIAYFLDSITKNPSVGLQPDAGRFVGYIIQKLRTEEPEEWTNEKLNVIDQLIGIAVTNYKLTGNNLQM